MHHKLCVIIFGRAELEVLQEPLGYSLYACHTTLLVWSGLVWSGLVWSGLVWSDLLTRR